jgi:hypothetical protein
MTIKCDSSFNDVFMEKNVTFKENSTEKSSSILHIAGFVAVSPADAKSGPSFAGHPQL